MATMATMQKTQPQIFASTKRVDPCTDLWPEAKWSILHDDAVLSLSRVVNVSIATGYLVAHAVPARIYSTAPSFSLFQHLVSQWHEERGATSSITKMAMCPAYQRIIAMGEAAIPLILRRLEQEGDEPDMWFWALRILTNADPVPDEARGDTVAMARAWLQWGRAQYAW